MEDCDHLIRIFIYAPYEDRIVNCVNDLGMDTKAAKRMIRDVDKARDAYHMRYAGYLPNDMNHMDLMVNSATLGVDRQRDCWRKWCVINFHKTGSVRKAAQSHRG